MTDRHESLIKTPKQLIIVITLAFVVPVLLIIMLAQLVTSGKKIGKESEQAVAARIKPVGELIIAGPRVLLSGEQVYNTVCATCHGTGLAGAPKFADKTGWIKILAQGQASVVAHAINGLRGMPPRGGNNDLSDEEVAAAVVHMANAAGAKWKVPEIKAGALAEARPLAPVTTTLPPSAPASPTTTVAAAVPAVSKSEKGKATFEQACAACHAQGLAGAPKTGDKAAWAPRIKLGLPALYASSIKGKGLMLPKGGNPSLPDADVKAAVDYMVSLAK